MPRKKIVAYTPKYYIHYDKKTGLIQSISPEKLDTDKHSVEISFEEFKLFSDGSRRPGDYIVIQDKNEITITQVNNPLQGFAFKNKSFEWIINLPTKTTELITIWDLVDNCWKFELSKSAKDRTATDVTTHAIFFITLEHDFDFLIRTIIIKIKDLVDNTVVIPFESDMEKHINKISISSKTYFQSYGLKINDK
jgi:hypothetical protein